jgi:hypothetical protein
LWLLVAVVELVILVVVAGQVDSVLAQVCLSQQERPTQLLLVLEDRVGQTKRHQTMQQLVAIPYSLQLRLPAVV